MCDVNDIITHYEVASLDQSSPLNTRYLTSSSYSSPLKMSQTPTRGSVLSEVPTDNRFQLVKKKISGSQRFVNEDIIS